MDRRSSPLCVEDFSRLALFLSSFIPSRVRFLKSGKFSSFGPVRSTLMVPPPLFVSPCPELFSLVADIMSLFVEPLKYPRNRELVKFFSSNED